MAFEVVTIGPHTLYRGDSREVLLSLGSFDACVTDPPYGVKGDVNSKTAKREQWSIQGSRKKNDYEGMVDSVEYVKTVVLPIFDLARAKSRRAVVTTGSRCFTLYPMPDSFGVFYQPASVGLQRWGRCDAQPILYYGAFPHASRLIPGNNCSFVLTEQPEPNGHPCPKPLKAWTKIVQAASLPGETVVDPFAGSFTTGVACVQLGRVFVGIEQETKYFDIGCKRIEAEMNRFPMFEETVKPQQQSLVNCA